MVQELHLRAMALTSQKGQTMKKAIITLAILAGITTTAYAYNCTTRCQWIFNQWTCNETCY
jgi:hypothetical protein